MCKTIKQKVRFNASPQQIYSLLTDSKLHTTLTKQRAKISRKIGGPFSTRNGRISGIIVDLAPNQRVVQAWRSKDFPKGTFSMATFDLSPTKSGGTEVILTHRGVPKTLIPSVEKDWRKIYWERVREITALDRQSAKRTSDPASRKLRLR